MSQLDYFFSCKMPGKIWNYCDTKIRGCVGGSALSKWSKKNRKEAVQNLGFLLLQRPRKIKIQQLPHPSSTAGWCLVHGVSFLAKPALCSWGGRKGWDPWGPLRGWSWQGCYLSPFEAGSLQNPLSEQEFGEKTPWKLALNLPKLTEVK